MELQSIDEHLQHEMDEILEEMKVRHGWIERNGNIYKKGTAEPPDMLSELFHSLLLWMAILFTAVALTFFNPAFYQELGMQGETMAASSSAVILSQHGLIVISLVSLLWAMVRVVVNNYYWWKNRLVMTKAEAMQKIIDSVTSP